MAGTAHSHAQPRRRPELYAGARRRFSGFGSIIAGFIALVLVLGALLTSELGRYGEQSTDSTPYAVQTTASIPAVQPPVATPSPQAAPTTSTSPTKAGTTVSDAVAAAVNDELDNLGCAPVTVDSRLVANAQSHTVQMVNSGYYDVVSQGGTGPQARAKAAGYTGKVTESIVLGAETATQAAQIAFPPPISSSDALPATVEVVAKNTLTCGWKYIGAEFKRDSRRVAVWSIVLGR